MHYGEVVIVSALRSAVGNFNGGLATMPAHKISEQLFKKALNDTNVPADDISEVIMGQVLAAGAGQNPARQASIAAGLSKLIPAWTVNIVCGSGLFAVNLAAEQLSKGRGKIILAGGHENMSLAPHFIHLRNGVKMGAGKLEDSMLVDGLTDAFDGTHMGLLTERIADTYRISKEEQDAFALASQHKAEKAKKEGRFKDEIAPIVVPNKKGDVVFDQDEFIREGATLEALTKLKPAFKPDGTISAGNASGINDGAAVVMLMSHEEAKKRGLKPIAKIVSFHTSGVEPNMMGIGPVSASAGALASAGWRVQDLDLIEANEAFAAQAIAVNRDMGWDAAIVNVNGGAIAIGHPIGASGCRVLVTLVHEMLKRKAKKGLVTLCVGGGMGVAMCVESI